MKASPTVTMILFIAGVLFTLTVLIVFFWPFMLTIIRGACWSNVNTMMHELDTDFESLKLDTNPDLTKTIILGDCVDKLVFTNRQDLRTAVEGVECSPGINSMIIVTPDYNWLENIEKSAKGVAAICRKIPCKDGSCHIEASPVILEGPGKDDATKEYCLGIAKKSSDTYLIVSANDNCAVSGTGVSDILS
jgi:hypothetical protein